MYLKQATVKELQEQGNTVKEIARITGAKVSNVKLHLHHLNKPIIFPELDTLTDHLINLIERAKKVSAMENENNSLKNKNAALHNQLQLLREKYQKKDEQDKRYKLAVMQGDVNKKL